MKCGLILVVMLAALLNLAGCMSSPVVMTRPKPVLTSKTGSLDFILVTTTNSLPDVDTEKALLKTLIISGLKETQLFTSVSGDKADNLSGGGIRIEAVIKEINKVSEDARLWFGGLAGRARILIQVTIFDLSSGKPIESFEVEGQSGSSAKSGTTDEAIQQAAQQVVAEVKQLNSRSAQ
jgi:hypothetical protein